jgi:assimilatory nitrate reductase catalytic subunit
MSEAVRTTCPYCGVGCGVLARAVQAGDGVQRAEVSGDPAHPANRGALCSKGMALGETVAHRGRLLQPTIGGAAVGWERALSHVAGEFTRLIAEHGPESVAFYVSGQLLTEDYYVANKLMKGFIGTANIDTNSRLCMSSAVAAHKRAFGEDLVPVCYEDLELADLIVLVGSNTAWCHPVLYQRIVRAKERRPELRIVIIDPRRTASCDIADLHLPLRAGTDVWLFNGLLSWLGQHDGIDAAYARAHTRGLARARLVADNTAGDVDAVARICGVDPAALRQFYRWFAATPRCVTAFSQGVNQSSSGTDKANSIINCHLATGRIGKPGMGPFSITGQPNAMGGREVGGLANTLAAHMELDDAAQRALVQQFWNSPRIAERPGLKAVDLFEAMHEGRIKAVWIMATNPVVSLPDADRVRRALQRCELVVVSDCVADTDTTRLAHVLLPAAAWGEKSGTVTNSDRHISRQRAFLPPAGAARPDWWIISEVARRMGFAAAFDYRSAAQIFAEHARLSGVGNHGTRVFDISELAAMEPAAYDALAPVQWPVQPRAPRGTPRLFADRRFAFRDGRARFVATTPRLPKHHRDQEFPLVLNTGRIRDQWHTMTRSGQSQRLSAHLPEPFVELHPQDALGFGLRQGSLVRVATRWGRMVGRLRTSGEVRRGDVFVPIHWSDCFASDARVGALVNPVVDPVSGEPEFKHTPARIEPFSVSWHGLVMTRGTLQARDISWWARSQGEGFTRYEIAGRAVPGDWSQLARHWLGASAADADWIDYVDAAGGRYRGAWLRDGRLEACVYLSPQTQLPSRQWLATLFGLPELTVQQRRELLAGRSSAVDDAGPLVCSCFSVGRDTIARAIQGGCCDVAQISRQLRAGTNCGSCIPELRRIVGEELPDGGATAASRG